MLNNKKDLLLEIGCEELPSSAVRTLAGALADLLQQSLAAANLKTGKVKTFATPRRLAVLIADVSTKQSSKTVERQGPSVSSAYDKNGSPTLACIGFAKSCGVSVDQLEQRDTDKGRRLYCCVKQPGSKTIESLPEMVAEAIKKLPIPKPMRWGVGGNVFLRPVHWVVLMFGRDVVPATILGQQTGSKTYGHRFHHPQAIELKAPNDYESMLKNQGYVVPDFTERKQQIEQQLKQGVSSHHQVQNDPALLNEVTGLVEWPVVLQGNFAPDFLMVPPEVLVTSMRSHQKCFSVVDHAGELQPHFLLVSNIASTDPRAVIAGNERVIRARLADAMFFYRKDTKRSLESRRRVLDDVVFQKQLGSVGDKAKRLAALSGYIGSQLNQDVGIAEQAGLLAKCDLVTDMVAEFPDLQGIVGCYYALHDGLAKGCAQAIREHYQPTFSGDVLPDTRLGCVVALADRLDTLIGILGINQAPTGDKDPFALRRAAYGVIRICNERRLTLDIMELLQHTKAQYQCELPNADVVDDAFNFIMTRLKHWYAEKGIAVEIFNAVSARRPTSLLDFDRRIVAVQAFQALPEASALAAANKRVGNILKKQSEGHIKQLFDADLLQLPEEKALAEQIIIQTDKVSELYQKTDYTEAWSTLAALKGPVDLFFDKVMVMVDDESVRNNRLALLASLHGLFTQVADIAQLPS